MRHSRLAAGCATVLLAATASTGQAQDLVPEIARAVDREVRDALTAEQAAFDAKDCAKVVEFFTDRSPLLVVSGRTMPNRNVLRMACTGMIANRAQSPRRLKEHVINVLSPEVAYSVTHDDVPVPAGGTTAQVVTKIWVKQDGAWLIAHMHESVRAAPPAP